MEDCQNELDMFQAALEIESVSWAREHASFSYQY